MAIDFMSYVRCDVCGNPAELGDDAREARALAKRMGFRKGFLGVDVCPACWAEGRIGIVETAEGTMVVPR